MKKVLIIFGGKSTEHYISCKSCKSIIENIDNKLFEYSVVGIDLDGNWYIFDDDLSYLENGNWKEANINEIDNIVEYLKEFDVVFPIIHGNNGEDGKLQGMFDLFNIKYVGCNTIASAICMDKGISKMLFDNLNLKQVPYIILNEDYNIDEIVGKLDFPLIVKPANGGSSIGISKAVNKEELISSIKEAKKYDSKVIIEKFVKVRELECAVLKKEHNLICSSPGEIISANEFYDYDAKYVNKKSYTTIASDLKEEVINKIKEYSSKIFSNLGLKDYARIDYFYDEENDEIYINEVNTIPGFTSISMFPKLIEYEGINYKDLISVLINNN